MITSVGPRGRFVIATPTKCGTTTLEEMARRHAGGRISRGGEWRDDFRIYDGESPRRQHRMALPMGDEWAEATRYLLVRNPFDRYVSMYEYLAHPANYSKWGAGMVQGSTWRPGREGKRSFARRGPVWSFEQFLWWLQDQRVEFSTGRWQRRRGSLLDGRAYRSPWVWLDPLDWSLDFLQMQGGGGEVNLLRLETLWDDLEVLKFVWGLKDLSVRATIHANKSLVRGPTPGYWQFGCARRLWRDGVWLGAEAVGSCGDCAACNLGVYEEAVVVGYA